MLPDIALENKWNQGGKNNNKFWKVKEVCPLGSQLKSFNDCEQYHYEIKI